MLTQLTMSDVLAHVAATFNCDAEAARDNVRMREMRSILSLARGPVVATDPETTALFAAAARLMVECLRRAPFCDSNDELAFGLVRMLLTLNGRTVEADGAAVEQLRRALHARVPRNEIYNWFVAHTHRVTPIPGHPALEVPDSVAPLDGVGLFVGHARSLVRSKVSRELTWMRDAVSVVTRPRGMIVLKPGLDCTNTDDVGRTGVARGDWAALLKRNWCEFGDADMLMLSADAVTVSVGWEFGWAVAARIPVVFVIDKEALDKLHAHSGDRRTIADTIDLTSLPSGHTGKLAEAAPNVFQIVYDSPEDLKSQLDTFLDTHAQLLTATRDDREAKALTHAAACEALQGAWHDLDDARRATIATAMRTTAGHLSLAVVDPCTLGTSSYDTIVTLATHLSVSLAEGNASSLGLRELDALRRAGELGDWPPERGLELAQVLLGATAMPAIRRMDYGDALAWQTLNEMRQDGVL